MSDIINIPANESFYSLYHDKVPKQFILERGARADIVIILLPGMSADINIDILLEGEGAEANIYGAYLCGEDERVNITLNMHHKVAHCNSKQLFKGVVGGKAKVDFFGKIIVYKDAQQTEAYQENHSILLNDNAKVNTKPQLEIYADDVKCTHGATIGKLNEEEQFYMRSRGISLKEARILQIISFVSPVFEQIQNEKQKEELLSLSFEVYKSL